MIETSKITLLNRIFENDGYLTKVLRLYKAEVFPLYSDASDLSSSILVFYSNSLEELKFFCRSICLYEHSNFYKKAITCYLYSFNLETSFSTPNLNILIENEEKYLTENNICSILKIDSRLYSAI